VELKVCCLFSGGKDSTYALHWAVLKGFDIRCLLTVIPQSPDSMLFHYPAVELTHLQAKAVGLDHIATRSGPNEEEALIALLKEASRRHGIDGIVSGALLSDYQRLRFSIAAEEAGLRSYTPLWRIDQASYMKGLVREGFEFIITRISSMGLPPSLLGRPLTERDIDLIIQLAERYGFNPAFEGGEAETLVVGAPLFTQRLHVEGEARRIAEDIWVYEIREARLEPGRRPTGMENA
jgi:diphthine-ammonia ligase